VREKRIIEAEEKCRIAVGANRSFAGMSSGIVARVESTTLGYLWHDK
jgi:hypothetical protein